MMVKDVTDSSFQPRIKRMETDSYLPVRELEGAIAHLCQRGAVSCDYRDCRMFACIIDESAPNLVANRRI